MLTAFCNPVGSSLHRRRDTTRRTCKVRMSSGIPKDVSYCPSCGSNELTEKCPPGDTRNRLVCDNCNYVFYVNPKVVASALALTEDRSRVLLVKRSIPPVGKWTLPAGFMELGETTADAARRETQEEANAEIAVSNVLGIYNILAAGQVQVLYKAQLLNENVSAGSETSDARLFKWDEIPWDSLAFATVTWALQYAQENLLTLDDARPQLRTKQYDGSFTDD